MRCMYEPMYIHIYIYNALCIGYECIFCIFAKNACIFYARVALKILFINEPKAS